MLRVRTIETAVAFYRDVLGCEVERRRDDLGLVHLRAGASLIDLVEVSGALGARYGPPAGAEGRNVDHIALALADFDERAIRDALAAHGIEAGELKSLFGASGVGPAFYIEDPDGNVVELKGPPPSAGSN